MEIPISIIYALVSVLIAYFAKWYHDHQTIMDLKKSRDDKEKRLKLVEVEVMKITEALERTYPNTEYIYDKFYDKEHIDMSLKHIQELSSRKSSKS